MRGLVFIISRSVKNTLLELRHKPSKLILYLVLVAAIAGMVVLSIKTPVKTEDLVDPVWLKIIIFAFLTFFIGASIHKGLSSGDTIFEMNDVNLLFVSPISPKSILLYGVVRMTKVAFLSGFFLLYQSNNLRRSFAVEFGGLLVILLCFILSVMLLTVLSLVIYSATNGNPGRKRIVRVLTALAFAPLAVTLVFQLLRADNALVALQNAMNSPALKLIPAAGWATQAATALVQGDLFTGLAFIGAILAATAGLVLYIGLGKVDYYEDVLVATESAFEKKRAAAQGQTNTETQSTRKIKVVKTGIGGSGASAFFHKHLRESLRVNPLGLLTWMSVIQIATGTIMGVLIGGDGSIVIILTTLMWMQLFFVGMGRGLKELLMPYIFLVPDSSLSKIVWSNLEPVAKTLIESVLIFGIAGAFMATHPLVILACIAAYALFTLLLIGVNYLSMRVMGESINAGLLLALYVLAVIVFMLPGVIPALIVGILVGGSVGPAAGLGILALWELAASLIAFALSKGVLHHCDMLTVGEKR